MAWGGKRPGAGRRPRTPNATVGPPKVAGVREPAGPLKITEPMLAMSRARPNRTVEDSKAAFVLPRRPPGVSADMAMDEAGLTTNLNWAANSITSIWSEGQGFMGYSELALLAQRPEYRAISEVLATEMTRKWIKLEAAGDEDKTEQIKQLNEELERLKTRDVFRECAEQDGFFGRSHIHPDFGDDSSPDELMTPVGDGWDATSAAKVGKDKPLQRLRSVEAVWCYPTRYNSNDPLRPDWYKPEMWWVMGKQVHASRLMTFVGREVPDMLKPAYSFGGLSMTQMAKPYVDNWLRTRQSVADIVHAFSVFVLKTNMGATYQTGGDDIFRRADFFNNLRDNRGLMMIDMATEEFENVSTSLASLDALQAQSQEQMSAVSRIPLVKLLGISPKGLNASSEGEIRVFYDWIAAYQRLFFTANLKRVLGFAMLSLWGKVDPAISFDYEPLYELTAKELAEKQKAEAETDQIHIDSGVISPEEARKRVATDPETPYAGLDIEDVPDLKEEEEAGLIPEGGAGGEKAVLGEEDAGGKKDAA